MITVEELVYEFKLMINKVNRQDNVDIPVEDVIVYLNRAQMSWIKTKINPNNVYKLGYEAIEKRIDDLQVLKQSSVRLNPIKTNDLFYLGYECPLEDAANYMFYVNSTCVAKKQDCTKNLTIDLVKQGDLNNMYLDANFSPSFEWRSTLATIGNDKLYVYTAGEFTIEGVYLTYLRYPNSIDIEGYTKLDGTVSNNVNCELPQYAKGDIVDLAVKFAAQSNDNQAQAMYAEDRLVKNSE
jgi:hypothetical protein